MVRIVEIVGRHIVVRVYGFAAAAIGTIIERRLRRLALAVHIIGIPRPSPVKARVDTIISNTKVEKGNVLESQASSQAIVMIGV